MPRRVRSTQYTSFSLYSPDVLQHKQALATAAPRRGPCDASATPSVTNHPAPLWVGVGASKKPHQSAESKNLWSYSDCIGRWGRVEGAECAVGVKQLALGATGQRMTIRRRQLALGRARSDAACDARRTKGAPRALLTIPGPPVTGSAAARPMCVPHGGGGIHVGACHTHDNFLRTSPVIEVPCKSNSPWAGAAFWASVLHTAGRRQQGVGGLGPSAF